MKLVDSVKRALGIEAPLAALRGQLGDFEAQHAALGQERDTLLTQPGTRADAGDVPALIAAYRAGLVSRYPELRELPDALTGALTVTPDGTVSRRVAHLPDVLARLPAFDLAVVLDPAGLAEKLVAVVPDGGLTIEHRLRRINEIGPERERIATEHAALVDRAASLGVTAAHLPVTLATRRAAQRAQERAEARQRDDALNAARRRS